MPTFYRGDSRTPSVIKASNGFRAWVPLDVPQARLLIKKSTNAKVADDAFPPALTGALKGAPISKLIDLQIFIKYTKNKSTTPQISTAPDEDCGGQANGKDSSGRPYVIYEIVLPPLNVMLQSGGVRALDKSDIPYQGMFPKVLIDGLSLDASKIIGVLMKDEIAFLTEIGTALVPRYKEQGKAWAAMP
jgi:hypothetical protein